MDLKNKKVLVTGADGFIGSHLTEMLLERGCKVKALSYYNSFNYWGWLEDIPENENLEIVIGDVRDPYFVKQIMGDVDVVFHLAALIAIPYSYQAPESYVDTNIKGTLNICQAAKEKGNTRVVHTSTSEVYGTAKYVPIDEKHPKQPQSPYSATKIAADALALSFHYAYSLPVIIARPFNTYGPRQSARAVIPTIITQIASGKKEINLGNVTPTRDFNYVKDTCRALIAIAEIDKITGIEINISTNNEISIKSLFDLICGLMGSDAVLQADEKRLRPESSEVFRLCGDNTLLKRLTHFEPAFSLKDGLQETIRWYLDPENLKKYKTHLYNV